MLIGTTKRRGCSFRHSKDRHRIPCVLLSLIQANNLLRVKLHVGHRMFDQRRSRNNRIDVRCLSRQEAMTKTCRRAISLWSSLLQRQIVSADWQNKRFCFNTAPFHPTMRSPYQMGRRVREREREKKRDEKERIQWCFVLSSVLFLSFSIFHPKNTFSCWDSRSPRSNTETRLFLLRSHFSPDGDVKVDKMIDRLEKTKKHAKRTWSVCLLPYLVTSDCSHTSFTDQVWHLQSCWPYMSFPFPHKSFWSRHFLAIGNAPCACS